MVFLLVLMLVGVIAIAWLLVRIEGHIQDTTLAVANQTEALRRIESGLRDVEEAVVSLQPDDGLEDDL